MKEPFNIWGNHFSVCGETENSWRNHFKMLWEQLKIWGSLPTPARLTNQHQWETKYVHILLEHFHTLPQRGDSDMRPCQSRHSPACSGSWVSPSMSLHPSGNPTPFILCTCHIKAKLLSLTSGSAREYNRWCDSPCTWLHFYVHLGWVFGSIWRYSNVSWCVHSSDCASKCCSHATLPLEVLRPSCLNFYMNIVWIWPCPYIHIHY